MFSLRGWVGCGDAVSFRNCCILSSLPLSAEIHLFEMFSFSKKTRIYDNHYNKKIRNYTKLSLTVPYLSILNATCHCLHMINVFRLEYAVWYSTIIKFWYLNEPFLFRITHICICLHGLFIIDQTRQ